jgi:hypothetical protein
VWCFLILLEQGPQSLESLEDFKRKLDNEHTTVSAKLDQGARARQELQELKSKLVEDLEVGLLLQMSQIISFSN